jgi:hypothetical protein
MLLLNFEQVTAWNVFVVRTALAPQHSRMDESYDPKRVPQQAAFLYF